MTLKEFFNKKMKQYKEMGFDSFVEFLIDNQYLSRKNKIPTPTKKYIESGYFDNKGKIIYSKADSLRDDIFSKFENEYFTWNEAIERTELKSHIFEEAISNLGYWDSETDEYTKKGIKKGIYYNLITESIIQEITNEAGPYDIDNVFLLQWFGPFSTTQECSEWLAINSISDKEFNFYYAGGKKPNKINYSFYIGVSIQDSISSRMAASTDPVTRDLRSDDSKEIWIGRFSEKRYRSNQKENSSYVFDVETALLYGFKFRNHNKIKKYPDYWLNDRKTSTNPKFPFCIVNQWYNKDHYNIYQRNPKGKICRNALPDVIVYNNEDSAKIAAKLK